MTKGWRTEAGEEQRGTGQASAEEKEGKLWPEREEWCCGVVNAVKTC